MKSRPRVLHTIGIARYTNIEYLFLLSLISQAARYSILHHVKQETQRKFWRDDLRCCLWFISYGLIHED